MTRWIFMDWVGTATNVGDTVIPELERFGKRCRITADWEQVMQAWGIGHRMMMDRILAGEEPWRPQATIFLDAFRAVLARVGVDIDTVPKTALEDLGRFLLNLKPWPDTKDGVAMLRLVRPTALYSLSPREMIELQTAEADVAFDSLISAEGYQSLPPSPEGFARAAIDTGVQPGEVVFLSSHPPMLRGAVDAGMRAIQIERPIRESRVVLFQPTRDLNLLGRFADLPKAAEWLAANLR
jgi:2-haloacid dehalogenase